MATGRDANGGYAPYPDCAIYVFARNPGVCTKTGCLHETRVFARNPEEREFALELGAVWAGETEQRPPERLHCIIDTTPAWKPVVYGLEALRPSGRLVINAIRKEAGDRNDLADINYDRNLWMEKEIKSVANVGRLDVMAFLKLSAEIPIRPEVQTYGLEEANQALFDLKPR